MCLGPPRKESLIFTRGIDDGVSEEVTFGAGAYTGPHGQLRVEEGRAGGAELGACVARALGGLRLSVCVWRWLAGARSGLLLFPRRSAICTEGVVLPPCLPPALQATQLFGAHVSGGSPASPANICTCVCECASVCPYVCACGMHVCLFQELPWHWGMGE